MGPISFEEPQVSFYHTHTHTHTHIYIYICNQVLSWWVSHSHCLRLSGPQGPASSCHEVPTSAFINCPLNTHRTYLLRNYLFSVKTNSAGFVWNTALAVQFCNIWCFLVSNSDSWCVGHSKSCTKHEKALSGYDFKAVLRFTSCACISRNIKYVFHLRPCLANLRMIFLC